MFAVETKTAKRLADPETLCPIQGAGILFGHILQDLTQFDVQKSLAEYGFFRLFYFEGRILYTKRISIRIKILIDLRNMVLLNAAFW